MKNHNFYNSSKTTVITYISLITITIVVLINNAWLCNDAFITYRTVDNFVNGHGLTWNVHERVQAFTHPLWMFLISVPYFFTGEMFFTPIIVSILVFGLAVSLLILSFRKNILWHCFNPHYINIIQVIRD